MQLKTIDQRVKELFDIADLLWLAEIGDRARLEQVIIEMLRDQIGDCREVARRRYEEAEMNRREYEGCGRTPQIYWTTKREAAGKIMDDIDALAAPYEPKRNPDIG